MRNTIEIKDVNLFFANDYSNCTVWAIAHGSIPQTDKGRQRKSMLIFIG